MGCIAAEETGLGFVCFVVCCQPTELIWPLLFLNFSNLLPPSPVQVAVQIAPPLSTPANPTAAHNTRMFPSTPLGLVTISNGGYSIGLVPSNPNTVYYLPHRNPSRDIESGPSCSKSPTWGGGALISYQPARQGVANLGILMIFFSGI